VLSFYGLLCICLAFTVFAWGTGYKLSLCKAEQQSSPAKLCTRDSDPAKKVFDHTAVDTAVAHAPLSIEFVFSPLQGTGESPAERLRDERIVDRSPLSRAPILYLRPPPDEGLSLD
jgi:hypothetical protein